MAGSGSSSKTVYYLHDYHNTPDYDIWDRVWLTLFPQSFLKDDSLVTRMLFVFGFGMNILHVSTLVAMVVV